MPGLFKTKAEKALDIEASLGALRSATNLTDEHYKDHHELMRELRTHPEFGLEGKSSNPEPNSKLRQNMTEYGRNEITLPPGPSKAARLLKYSMGFAPLLWLAAVVHVIHGWHTNDVASMDSAFVFVLLCFFQGGLLYFVNERDDHFDEPYVIIEERKYLVMRNGREENVKAVDLVVGDILVNLGENNNFPWRHTIPADIRILECTDDCAVDNSLIVDSGDEALTIQLRTDERQPLVKGIPPLKATNIGLRGTEIVHGIAKRAVVIKTGNNTHIGRTLKTMRELEAKKGKSKAESESEMEFLLNVFFKAAITCGLIAAAASYFMNGTNFVGSLTVFSATSIAAIPCGLTVVMTFILRVAFKRLESHGIKVSNLSCIEKMGAINYLVVDTYGPLTPVRRKISNVVYIDDEHHDWVTHDNDAEYFRDAHHEPGTHALQFCVAMTMDENVRFVSKAEDSHGSRFDRSTGKQLPYQRVTHNAHGHTVFEVLWDTIETNRPYDGALLRFYHQQKHVWFREYTTHETKVVAKKEIRQKVTKYRSLHDVRNEFQSFCAFVDPVRKIEVNVAALEPKTKRCDKAVFMRGDPREVLRRCAFAFSEAEGGIHKPLDEYEKLKIIHTISKLENSGKHVKALARSPHLSYDDYSEKYQFTRPVDGEQSANFPMGETDHDAALYREGGQDSKAREKLSFVGLVAFEEPVHEVKHAVEEVKEAGVKVIMTTVLEAASAVKVARQSGIVPEDQETDLDVIEHNAWLDEHIDLVDPDQICEQMALALDMPPALIKEKDMYRRREPQEAANCCVIVADRIRDGETDTIYTLEELDDDWWDFHLNNYNELIICRCEPVHKQVLIEKLKKHDNVVAVTGNSISDMIAIKEADLSIACVGGADSCIDAADVTLETGEFESITQMIKEGRRVFDNMKKGLAFIMVSNVPQMAAYFAFAFAQIPLPFVAIYIVLIDLASNLIAAIGMSEEEAETDLMARPPRKLGRDRMVSFKTFFFAYFQLGIIEAFACAFAFLTVMADYGYPPHILPQLGANENWGRFPLYCKFNRGQYVNTKGEIDIERNPSFQSPAKEYPLWDEGDGGYVEQCVHPPKIFAGAEGFPEPEFAEKFDKLVAASYTDATVGKDQLVVEVIDALEASNYYEYIPWKARMSPFWDNRWLSWDISEEVEREAAEFLGFMGPKVQEEISTDSYLNSQPYGLWSLCLADPDLKSHQEPENTFERRHSHVRKSEEPASGYNASKDFSTYCNRGTEVWEYPMEEYTKALFCNGDNSWDLLTNDTKFLNTLSEEEQETVFFNAKACSKIAKHAHNVKYCIDECSIDCHKSPLDKRLNQTLEGVVIKQCFSVASRWAQTETIYTARTAAFIAIVICQIAAALSIKTRWISIQVHGFGSNKLQLGMFTSLLIVAWMQYTGMASELIQTRPLRLSHWFPGIPWAIVLFIYDETRKFLMRNTSRKIITPTGTKRTIGWLEANLYY